MSDKQPLKDTFIASSFEDDSEHPSIPESKSSLDESSSAAAHDTESSCDDLSLRVRLASTSTSSGDRGGSMRGQSPNAIDEWARKQFQQLQQIERKGEDSGHSSSDASVYSKKTEVVKIRSQLIRTLEEKQLREMLEKLMKDFVKTECPTGIEKVARRLMSAAASSSAVSSDSAMRSSPTSLRTSRLIFLITREVELIGRRTIVSEHPQSEESGIEVGAVGGVLSLELPPTSRTTPVTTSSQHSDVIALLKRLITMAERSKQERRTELEYSTYERERRKKNPESEESDSSEADRHDSRLRTTAHRTDEFAHELKTALQELEEIGDTTEACTDLLVEETEQSKTVVTPTESDSSNQVLHGLDFLGLDTETSMSESKDSVIAETPHSQSLQISDSTKQESGTSSSTAYPKDETSVEEHTSQDIRSDLLSSSMSSSSLHGIEDIDSNLPSPIKPFQKPKGKAPQSRQHSQDNFPEATSEIAKCEGAVSKCTAKGEGVSGTDEAKSSGEVQVCLQAGNSEQSAVSNLADAPERDSEEATIARNPRKRTMEGYLGEGSLSKQSSTEDQ